MVLARKYRPQSFDQVVGQQHVVRTLKNAILQGRLAHAFLFSGIRGVGKTTIARILAKAINCEKGPTPEPCNQCLACLEITEGRAVDVQEIDAASNRGIDEIRELRENIKFRPARLRSKVYIIDEAHMLTREAFNALLKTLEEPPPHVHFILATTEPQKIPLTILSRCQRYEFKRFPWSELVEHLQNICQKEGVPIEKEALEIIAREAEGSVRDALSLLDQAISSGVRTSQELLDLFGLADHLLLEEMAKALLARDLGACFSILQKAFDQGLDLVHFAQDLAEFFRHLLVLKNSSGRALLDLPESELAVLRTLSLEAETEEILLFFQILLGGLETVRRSPVPKLALELVLARACEVGKIIPLENLLAKIEELKKQVPLGVQESSAPSVAETPPSSISVSWGDFVTKVRKESPSLGAFLETLDPPEDKNRCLLLRVPEDSILAEKSYRDKLSSLARKYLKKEIEIETFIPRESFPSRQKLIEKPIVQEALKILGGRIAQVKLYEKE